MIKSTKNYSMFKFTDDNREKGIRPSHLKKVQESIQSRNMLELRPIIVDSNFNVIDGQHRLKAAENLGLEIFYEVKKDAETLDIILLNISKPWGMGDYFNYYVKHMYPEYLKLQQFMIKNNLILKVALNMTRLKQGKEEMLFKEGKYIFTPVSAVENINVAWVIIDAIKKFNGHAPYTHSTKFWRALSRLINAPEFELTKWLSNFEKFCHKMVAKSNEKDYLQVMEEIYNWKNLKKIELCMDKKYKDE